MKILKQLLYRYLISLGWFLVPTDWSWMSGRYKRRKIYEFLRSEVYRLEEELVKAKFERIRSIQKRYQ